MSFSSSSTTTSRIPKPSNLKPPSHGHSSSLPKFSSTSSVSSVRSSSDSHKENETPSAYEIERQQQRQQTSKLSSTLPPNSIQITHADRYDEKALIAKINSITSISSSNSFHSGISRVGSDHSKFDAESVLSVDTKSSVNSKSTIGGGSIASARTTGTGSRLASTASLASTARKFDVSKTTSSTQNLPKPPKPTTTVRSSQYKTVGGEPLTFPPSVEPSSSRPSSTQSSPSSKSLRSTGSIPNSPNRDPPVSKYSPAKEKAVSSNISKFSPDRKKTTAQTNSPSLQRSPSNDSLTAISERIQEDMMFLDRYFQTQQYNSSVDLARLEIDPVLNQFERQTKIDGMEVGQFINYITGEDVLNQMFQDHEKTYGNKLIADLEFPEFDKDNQPPADEESY